MPRETPEVTENPAELTLRYLEEIAVKVRRLDAALAEWAPVLDQFKNPVSAYGAARRARRNGRTPVQ